MTEGRFGRLTDAPASFVLVGGRVIDPEAGRDEVRDLAVVDGVMVDSVPDGAERIDARGLIVAPGLCDLHTHLREPGTEGETMTTGTRAAARGGFTTVCAMPNTDPPCDTAERVQTAQGRATDAACRVRVIAAATRGRVGADPTDVEELAAAGVVGFSDDGAGVASEPVAEELLRRLVAVGLPLVEHPEDAGLAGGGVMRAGATAVRLGLPGWVPAAETSMVERDLRLAEAIGAWIHLTHLSSTASIEAVRRAKARGVRVTCDVTPHHLALTDTWVAGSRRFAWDDADDTRPGEAAYEGSTRVNPPLSTAEEALTLLAAVEDGTVDAIATDHAPHPPERKAVPFAEAAPGLIGLETALSIGLAAVGSGRIGLHRLMAALSTRPAALIGESRSLATGSAADLVVFDPAARWRVAAESLASASSNTPLLGMELPGAVLMTVAEGRITYRA
ncbi:MAG TPA: dihydroorotase [Candidatus Angelobacter sp.]|nr:dihydroorotase [Candidatus Angelobacter sp.]